MSTSLLYHAFGIRGYEYQRSGYVGGEVYFVLLQERKRLRCANCGSAQVTAHGGTMRCFHSVPIGLKKTHVLLTIPRVECVACRITRQVRVSFADPKRTCTHAFERYAVELCRHMTMQDVARHLGVSWDVIKDMQKRHLQQHYGKPKLKKLQRLAIDEIAVAKGHRYLTVVLNLDSGVVVFVGDGKGAAALKPFWKRLRGSGAKVKAVAIDMSPAYIEAVQTHLPRAAIVFDHFHVIKLFNDKLSAFRRELYREASEGLHKQVLKGTRWLLLKNPENLAPERRERQRLEEALRLNQPLATAYYMKADLRQVWMQPDKATAKRVLTDWLRRAEASGIKVLQQMAATLGAHSSGILNYYDYRISTGHLEGLNNKIKTMKRQAYGFRDREFFKLKSYALHEPKYALVG